MELYRIRIEYEGGYGSDKYFYGNKGLNLAWHEFYRAKKDESNESIMSAKLELCEPNYRGEIDSIRILKQFKQPFYLVPAELE
jgi:hypothetical protein